MKDKKAATSTLQMVVGLVIAAALIYIGFSFIGGAGKRSQQLKDFEVGADGRCKTNSELNGISNDIDGDGRDDGCDWCVCASGCNNDKDDKDGDKLPDKCDADPDDRKVVRFNPDNCDEDHLVAKETICKPS